MSDLSGRRARVTGSDADPDRDRTTVRAEIPEVELLGYPGVLRSVTHGTGQLHPPADGLRAGAGIRRRPRVSGPAAGRGGPDRRLAASLRVGRRTGSVD